MLNTFSTRFIIQITSHTKERAVMRPNTPDFAAWIMLSALPIRVSMRVWSMSAE